MTKQKKTRKIDVAKQTMIRVVRTMIDDNVKDVNVDIELLNFLHDFPPDDVDIPLASVSKRDLVWDTHRNDTDDVSAIYATDVEFIKYHERMKACSTYLEFNINSEKGLLLRRSFFCHVRNCPVCQWRKSLYWKAMMYKTYDKIKGEYGSHRWLFLTLTLENCHISQLRETIKHMSQSFKRLTKRKEFRSVVGYVRSTEVTRDKKRPLTHAHPHFHCMLLVEPSYFGKNYVTHMQWVSAWALALKVDYLPDVDIRAVKSKSDDDNLRTIVAETLKYACKPDDMLFDASPVKSKPLFDDRHFWFLEYTRQVHKLRFVDTGGILKNALKAEKDITDADMIALSDDQKQDDESKTLHFSYHSAKRSYILNPSFV